MRMRTIITKGKGPNMIHFPVVSPKVKVNKVDNVFSLETASKGKEETHEFPLSKLT